MLRPLTNKLLIRPEKAPEQTESGLHLVEHWKPENVGEIVAVPERTDAVCAECGHRMFFQPTVKVGDTVIFPLEVGQELTVNGERFLLMKETDLSAVYEPQEA